MRLAERRGLLVGVHLSRVQERALVMLMALDDKEKAKQFVDSLRAKIVGAHPETLRKMFPEWFEGDGPDESESEDAVEAARREDGSYDIDALDDSKVRWEAPKSTQEHEDLARFLMRTQAGMTVSAADLEEGWQ